MDCIVHGVPKSWAQLSNFHFHFNISETSLCPQLASYPLPHHSLRDADFDFPLVFPTVVSPGTPTWTHFMPSSSMKPPTLVVLNHDCLNINFMDLFPQQQASVSDSPIDISALGSQAPQTQHSPKETLQQPLKPSFPSIFPILLGGPLIPSVN